MERSDKSYRFAALIADDLGLTIDMAYVAIRALDAVFERFGADALCQLVAHGDQLAVVLGHQELIKTLGRGIERLGVDSEYPIDLVGAFNLVGNKIAGDAPHMSDALGPLQIVL